MRVSILACTLAFAAPGLTPALAQTTAPAPPPQAAPPAPGGAVIGGQNNTGGDANVTIPRGATGAGTVQTDSAAGGNASQPSRAVPQGSGGSGGN